MDKLQYVLHIKTIPTEEGRAAELALFRRRPDECKSVLLQANLTYRAIKMNIRLFAWER
jgi:intraflagellar transport protein 80